MSNFLRLRSLVGTSVMVSALLTGGYASLTNAAPFDHHDRGTEYGDLHNLIDRAQQDLRAAEQSEPDKGKTRVRYENAQKHLSTVDRHLSKGKFDKETLDSAIGDIQSVLDHNTLMASARESLLLDVNALREARSRRY